MIKTIKLTGTEQAVKFAGKHTHFHVHSLGGEVLVSLAPNVERGADGVLIVQGGGAGYVQNDMATDTIYLVGSGEVQVVGSGNAFSPFKVGAEGGGELTAEGGTVKGTVDYPIIALNLYGNSVQDGTPTPDAPIDIVSVGDDGAVIITVDNGGDIILSAEITSGLPLCSVGNVRDELVYNADGTGKIIKRTAKIVLDGSNDEAWQNSEGNAPFQITISDGSLWESRLDLPRLYCNKYQRVPQGSMWGSYDYMVSTDANGTSLAIRDISVTTLEEFRAKLNAVPMTVVYVLATPKEIELSADEITALMKLQTFDGTTNIYNDEDAEMKVKIAANATFVDMIKPVLDGFDKRIASLEAAVTAFMEG